MSNYKAECDVELFPYDVEIFFGGVQMLTEPLYALNEEHAAFIAGVLAGCRVLALGPDEVQMEVFTHNLFEHMSIEVFNGVDED